MALAKRPIVDTQDAGSSPTPRAPAVQAAQQGVRAGADPQTRRQPRSCFAPQGVADLIQGLRLATGPAGVVPDEGGEALGEDSGGAVRLITEEAAEAELELDGDTVPGQVGYHAGVAALDV